MNKKHEGNNILFSRKICAILIVLGLTSCTTKDEHYYQSHPDVMQKVIKLCPEQQPEGLTCQQLETLATRMNSLAYQLQMSPQGFGTKILELQETIAKQQNELKTEHTNTELQTRIIENQRDLEEHLAVVKWLESPTS